MSIYIKYTSPLIKHLLNSFYPTLTKKEISGLITYYPKLINQVPDKNEIVQLKALLILLNLRIGNLIFFNSFKKITGLSRNRIEVIFKKNLESKIMLKRKATFNILSLLGILVTRENNHATEKLWKSMNYPQNINVSAYSYKKNEFNGEEIDVAVIGSGAGGGVAAGVISESSRKVSIFEKSKEMVEAKSSVSEGEAYSQLYEASGLAQARGSGALLLAGSTLGGGTTINWTTSFEPPPLIRKEWEKISKTSNTFTSNEFSQSIKEVMDRINVNLSSNKTPRKEMKLKEGLELIGIETKEMARNVKGCDGAECGFCGFGCINEKKQSTKETWIKDAQKNGANIYSEFEIDSINIEKGRARSLNVVIKNQKKILPINDVILAAGALNTPNILRKSGYRNKHLGNNLKLHPVSGVIAEFDEAQNPWMGSMQGIYSDQFLYRKENYGYIIEGLPLHPGLFVPFFSSIFEIEKNKFLDSYPNWSGAIVLTSDSGGGKVRYNQKGPVWHYKLNKLDNENLLHGLISVCRAYEAAGAKKIAISSCPNYLWTRNSNESFEKFLGKIESIKNQPYRLAIGSAHQMGSAKIGVDEKNGVCDENGKVHGLDNVYVVDSSTFPRCSGVNPMVSIQAMSHYLSTKFVNSN